MIVVMLAKASEEQMDRVREIIHSFGFKAYDIKGEERTVIGVVGDDRRISASVLEVLPGVDKVVPILKPFKRVALEAHSEPSVIDVSGVKIGGDEVVVIAGPCAIESREQLSVAAHAVKKAGAKILRGGAFKPRTSPYSFQGLGEEGLKILAEVKEEVKLPVVTEAMSPEFVPMVADYADMIQVGARNMQNYTLLQEVGKINRPVLLKRGMMSTIEELLLSAEYILDSGNPNVVLCERGIRTFETYTRFTLDISAIPVIKKYSHLPVLVDPSHATGHSEYINAVSRAGVAVGADGIFVEVHPWPEQALCDGEQAVRTENFARLVRECRVIATAIGRIL